MDRLPHIFRAFFAPLSRLYLVSLIALISLLSACGGDDDDSDTTAPIVSIEFPPPASMTEGDTVRVRGTAMDSRSDVSSVEVNGLAVMDTSSDGSFATWEIVVNLVEGENTLTVSASDSEENMDSEAASVMVKRDPNMGDFPNSEVPIAVPIGLTVDYSQNRLIVGESLNDSLIAIDLETGMRSELSTSNMEDLANPFRAPGGLLVDSNENIVWVGDSSNDALFSVNLATGTRTLVSDDTIPNDLFPFWQPREIIEDPNDSGFLLIADGSRGVKRVNKLTGERTIFSDENTPDTNEINVRARGIVLESTTGRERIFVGHQSEGVTLINVDTGAASYFSTNDTPNSDIPLFDTPSSLALDLAPERDRLLVLDNGRYRITTVDLETSERSVFSGDTTESITASTLPEDFVPDDVNIFIDPDDMYYDGNLGYILVTDVGHNAILAVDIISGERVFVSVGKEPIP